MTGAIPILLYHSVDILCSRAYRRWMMLPEEFDQHMGYLAGNGYHPITVSSLVSLIRSKTAPPLRTVVITFDDGLRDFLTGAMPILNRYQFPATLFAVPGCAGQTSRWLEPLGEGGRQMLGWAELRDLAMAGIEIGAHTISHPHLDVLPKAKAQAEIYGSKSQLEDHLGRQVESFAYPHGYSSRIIRRLVREAGFASACRVRHALSSTAEDPFGLSRIIMTSTTEVKYLPALLSGSSLPIAPPIEGIAATGWRMVRRFNYYAGLG